MLHVFIYVWLHDLNNILWSFLPPLCRCGSLGIFQYISLTTSWPCLFCWLFYLFAYQMLSPFPASPPQIFYPFPPVPASMSCSPNHMSTPSSFLCILLCWVIEPSQDHEPPLPLIADKVILWYIWSRSHESLHMSSLFGGLVPGSSGDSGLINNI